MSLHRISNSNSFIRCSIFLNFFSCRLKDNPVCQETNERGTYCSSSQSNFSYSTQPNNCEPDACSSEQTSSPNCKCAYPYTGTLAFRSPSFSDLDNITHYSMLEDSLMRSFKSHFVPVDSVLLSHPSIDSTGYLKLSLQVFPSGLDYFNRTGTSTIGFMLSNQTFKPPQPDFGPFFFLADGYEHFGNHGKNNFTHDWNKIVVVIAPF